MSNNWFKVSISFNHIDEKGNEKKTVEQHLFDAISYAEAEERMYKKAEIMIHGEFKLESVTKQKISDADFSKFRAKISSRIAFLEKSIVDHEKNTNCSVCGNPLTNSEIEIGNTCDSCVDCSI